MEISFREKFEMNDFIMDSVTIVEKKNNKLVLNIVGDINPLIKKISAYTIDNLVFPEPTLEDTFLTFYKD